jgi:hypothetical protein
MDDLAWFPLLFGGVMVFIGIQAVRPSRRVKRQRRDGLKASGVVVGFKSRQDSESGRTDLFPVVQFQASDGRLVTADTDFSPSPVPTHGELLDVLYDPGHPDEPAHLASDSSDSNARTFGVIGWALIGVGTIIVVTVLVNFFSE